MVTSDYIVSDSNSEVRKNLLTLEEIDALERFAGANGRRWKAELHHLWMTGAYRYALLGGADPMYLQQIRNAFGPCWLVRFSLKQCLAARDAIRRGTPRG